MSFHFTPLSEEELNKRDDLLEEGIYDFEVLSSEHQISEAGNPMSKLTLNVWDKEGRCVPIFDYLVFSQTKLCLRKIRHFCHAVGIIDDYEKGELRENFKSLSGKVLVGVQAPKPKGGGSYYPEKNVVIDYIIKDNSSPKKEDSGAPFDDDIAF
jgi:hypothetical protein